jgi:signal transduction histidine kinase
VLLVFVACLFAAAAATFTAVRTLLRRPPAVAEPGRFQQLVEGIDAVAFEYAPGAGKIRYVSPQVHRLLGRPDTSNEFLGDAIHPEDRERVHAAVREYAAGSTTGRIDYRLVRGDGDVVHVRTLLGERDDGVVRGVTIDATKQTRQEAERREAHKLASIGRLAAGVAHEINTPVQFTQDSLQFVRESMASLVRVIERHRELVARTCPPEVAAAALVADEEADLEYLLANVPDALERASDGLDRVSNIVRSLRQLSIPDRIDRTAVELADALGDMVAGARDEYAKICDVVDELHALPRVTGNRQELRLVFQSLLDNAARAIADSGKRGTITVRADRDDDHLVLAFADTGIGVAPDVRHLVFEPFFTTRAVGQARGQGLAVSRAVIAKHGGTLSFESQVGVGSTFTIRLPIAAAGKVTAGLGVAA